MYTPNSSFCSMNFFVPVSMPHCFSHYNFWWSLLARTGLCSFWPIAHSLQKCYPTQNLAFQMVLMVKNPPAKAGDMGSIPGLGRFPGVGNGNPLQYSCLENPMDRGTGQAAVHRVTKSHTGLKQHTHTHTHTFLLPLWGSDPFLSSIPTPPPAPVSFWGMDLALQTLSCCNCFSFFLTMPVQMLSSLTCQCLAFLIYKVGIVADIGNVRKHPLMKENIHENNYSIH